MVKEKKKVRVMSKFDFVVFDLDGTLLNTLEDLADSVNAALENNGYPAHLYADYRTLVGKGALNLITRSLPETARTDEIVEKVHAEFSEIYAQNCFVKTDVYPGILEALERIAATGVKMAVLSNKPDRYMQGIRERYYSNVDFAAFRGKREGIPVKPDPAGIEALAKEAGASLDNAVYIGDSSVDMQTAKNSSLFACGVLWGFRSREELEQHGADCLVASPEELAEFIVEA